MRRALPFLFALIVSLALGAACSPLATETPAPVPTSTETVQAAPTDLPYPYPQPGGQETLLPSPSPYPQPQNTVPLPSATVTASSSPQATQTLEPYPESDATEDPYPYPNPVDTEPYPDPYFGPSPQPQGTATLTPTTRAGAASPTPTIIRPSPTSVSTEVAALQTAAATRPTATLYVPNPLAGQVKMSGQVTIWHALDAAQLEVLKDLVKSFVRFNPEVSFEFQYFPVEILRLQFYTESYRGGGPSILIAPAEWAVAYYADHLVEDLNPYIANQFRDTILPAPLESCQVNAAQVALPMAQTGLVLFRNSNLVASPAADIASLKVKAEQATRAGRVGMFIDLGAESAASFLPSQGGSWADFKGFPVFDRDNYAAAKKWLSLLKNLDSFSGVEFSQFQSLTYFEQGRVGMTFADVSQRRALAAAVGTENLVIDPWPSPLGSWVKSTAVYLNANVILRSSTEHTSALLFMGALLSESVQSRLAAAGVVPVVRNIEILDPLDASAYATLSSQRAAFPNIWVGDLRTLYLSTIDRLIQQALIQNISSDKVLPEAWQNIRNYFK